MENSKRPTMANGKICFLEIPSVDINQSANFYKNVFGWTIRQSEDGYTSFDDAVGEVSGAWVEGKKPDAKPGIVISIMVANITDTLKAVITNGGAKVDPMGQNWPHNIAKFSDPTGNVFCLYQSSSLIK